MTINMDITQASFRGLQDFDLDEADIIVEQDEGDFSEERFGLFVFVVAGSVALVLFLGMLLREYYWTKYGVDVCPSYRSREPQRPRLNSSQIVQDRALAEDLQRQLNDEERETERMAKRRDRRAWYMSYIKSFTMTAEKKDFFYAVEMDGDNIIPQVNGKNVDSASANMTDDDDDDDEEDLEMGIADPSEEPVACDENDVHAHLYLRLPVLNESGVNRVVDAHCAICVSEYEEGDKVTWSGLTCRHGFHDECILPWLSKGKKRCPICRHWFVPGARIDDQKKALEVRLRREASLSGSEGDETNSESEVLVCQPVAVEEKVDSQSVSNSTEEQNDATDDTQALSSGQPLEDSTESENADTR